MQIYSIGHSKHSSEHFVSLLKRHDLEMVVDVRRFPRSRFNPQFNLKKLKETLNENDIAYESMPELGGRRNPAPESVNTGWKEPAFQGYADFMQTAEFEHALAQLRIHAASRKTAFLCAEADYHRCHRRLLSDALTVHGSEVLHITESGIEPHTLTEFAHVEGTRVTYPAKESQPSLFE